MYVRFFAIINVIYVWFFNEIEQILVKKIILNVFCSTKASNGDLQVCCSLKCVKKRTPGFSKKAIN